MVHSGMGNISIFQVFFPSVTTTTAVIVQTDVGQYLLEVDLQSI